MWGALQSILRLPQEAAAKQTGSSAAATAERPCSRNSGGTRLHASPACTPDLTQHQLFGQCEDYMQAKQAFLNRAGNMYGYSTADSPSSHRLVDSVRAAELKRLHHQAYLDHGGAALYSERQLQEVFEELSAQLLSNPHSAHGSSGNAAGDADAELRRLTLDMLNASGQDYDVVLTSGATAALKLVGETFPWTPSSTLTNTLHNHNSVLGLREYALAAGASVHTIDLEAPPAPGTPELELHQQQQQRHQQPHQQQQIQQQQEQQQQRQLGPYHVRHCSSMQRQAPEPSAASRPASAAGVQAATCHLFAMPSECNFSGWRYDLAAACAARGGGLHHAHLQQGSAAGGQDYKAFDGQHAPTSSRAHLAAGQDRCLVLVDAAKGCATAPPDLSVHPVDFLVLSYYKMFGYPTGLGALVVRKDALPLLRKRYFAGGTVLVAVADEDYAHRRPGHAGLEDGTLPFTSIAAARHGFRFLNRLGGFPAISRHAHSLAHYLASSLAGLRYSNGRPAAVLYGWGQRQTPDETSSAPASGPGGSVLAVRPLSCGQGPTVAFNLLRADGGYVGYAEVRSLAALHGVHLRCGCFCNPGACAKFLNLSGDDLRKNFEAGHVCWDDQDLVGGRPTGAVRASLGATSSFEEVYLLLRLIHHYWVLPDLQAGVQRPLPGAQRQPTTSPEPEMDSAFSLPMCPVGPVGEGSPGPAQTSSQRSAPVAAGSPAAEQAPPRQSMPAAPGCAAPAAPEDPNAGAASSLLALAAASVSGVAAAGQGAGVLTGIFLYPVKSCAAQQVSTWPVGPTGLLFDREWALLDDSGKVLTQKKCPKMASLAPHVDLEAGTLTLSAPGCEGQLVVRVAGLDRGMQQVESIQVCGDRVCGLVVGHELVAVRGAEEASTAGDAEARCSAEEPSGSSGGGRADAVRRWFQQAIGVPCRLVRQTAGARRTKRTDVPQPLVATLPADPAASAGPEASTSGSSGVRGRGGSGDGDTAGADAGSAVGFANDGQYLLVNTASIEDLNTRLAASSPRSGGASGVRAADERRFRPNLVVSGFPAYAEDLWAEVQVGGLTLDVLGTCPRCEMLQVDQESGTKGRPDILIELAQYRRQGGKMHFGLLLANAPDTPAAAFQGPLHGSASGGLVDTSDSADQSATDKSGHSLTKVPVHGASSMLAVGMHIKPRCA